MVWSEALSLGGVLVVERTWSVRKRLLEGGTAVGGDNIFWDIADEWLEGMGDGSDWETEI